MTDRRFEDRRIFESLPAVLSTSELSTKLGISKSTLYFWIRQFLSQPSKRTQRGAWVSKARSNELALSHAQVAKLTLVALHKEDGGEKNLSIPDMRDELSSPDWFDANQTEIAKRLGTRLIPRE